MSRAGSVVLQQGRPEPLRIQDRRPLPKGVRCLPELGEPAQEGLRVLGRGAVPAGYGPEGLDLGGMQLDRGAGLGAFQDHGLPRIEPDLAVGVPVGDPGMDRGMVIRNPEPLQRRPRQVQERPAEEDAPVLLAHGRTFPGRAGLPEAAQEPGIGRGREAPDHAGIGEILMPSPQESRPPQAGRPGLEPVAVNERAVVHPHPDTLPGRVAEQPQRRELGLHHPDEGPVREGVAPLDELRVVEGRAPDLVEVQEAHAQLVHPGHQPGEQVQALGHGRDLDRDARYEAHGLRDALQGEARCADVEADLVKARIPEPCELLRGGENAVGVEPEVDPRAKAPLDPGDKGQRPVEGHERLSPAYARASEAESLQVVHVVAGVREGERARAGLVGLVLR